MGKRGPYAKGKVNINWSSNFAYAIGLLATDGCLYKDGRHIEFTSKDKEQVFNFLKSLGIENKIVTKISGLQKENFRVQFSDVLFYRFLQTIGITPAKSKTINQVAIPDEFFIDFLRGCFDGDGTFYSYMDKRWKSSHMFYLELIAASYDHLIWIQAKLKSLIAITGSLSKKQGGVYKLRYAKIQTLEIIKKMYYSPDVVCLLRKRLKIENALLIEEKQ